MKEGGTYKATAVRAGKVWTLSITKPKRLSVKGEDLEELRDELAELICEKCGDGEANVDIVAEEPGVKLPAGPVEMVELLPNAKAEAEKLQPGLYRDGYCDFCGAGIGPRTEAILAVKRLPRAGLADVDNSARCILLTTKELAEALQLPGPGCELRPVALRGKLQHEFLEIVVKEARPCVAKKGQIDCDTSFRCQKCGFRQIRLEHPIKVGFFLGMSEADLPTAAGAGVVIGDDASELDICVTKETWKAIGRSPMTKQVASNPVIVVAAKDVDPKPKVPDIERE